ncbi:MAG: TonB-dependent receptor [Crocinitomicaceae bacterium]|nr:TonB-dependent receptor [Crocinitomicaceae bacterium]MBT6514277.1 TonB-dependent receptor [Crocinitomicaceae bacterium]
MNDLRAIIPFLIFFPIFSFAQHDEDEHEHDEIHGIVVEDFGDSLSPIPGAQLTWLGSTITAITDADGKFEIEHDDEYHDLVIEAFGFKTDTIEFEHEEFLSIVIRDGNLIEGVVVEFDADKLRLSLMDPLNAHLIDQGELRKAACCSLAESFETDPSVDASFTDAVTGTRQIQMMGLSGKYVQLMQDNIPMTRGLATVNGLEFTPGAWINSIQVSKGAGSVVNGYESLTGQINVDWKKPGNAEQLHVNVYGNQSGRAELNVIADQSIGNRWESTLLVHGKQNQVKWDNNQDGFMDNPLSSNFNVHNQWNFVGDNLHVELGAGALAFNTVAGQMDYNKGASVIGSIYGVELETRRAQGFAKIGYLYPDEHYKSIAIQLSGSYQKMNNLFDRVNYSGEQLSGVANLIYQDEIGESEKQTFRTGISFLYDEYQEIHRFDRYARLEMVPGAYFEYNLAPNDDFTLVAGMRGDLHNLYGFFYSPRLHLRYKLGELSAIKLSAGKGQRTPNIFAENIGYFASSRQWVIEGDTDATGYGLQPEIAWNFGFNFTKKFLVGLAEREGSWTVDLYHTRFENQVVIDLEDATMVRFYNLNGQSFSSSIQTELNYELMKRTSIRLAYRYLDVRTDYISGLLERPFVPKHRGFINLEYATKETEKEGSWKFDATVQWTGEQRIACTKDKSIEYRLPDYTDPFFVLNGQVSKIFNPQWEIYVGGENLLNYKQTNPILASSEPFSSDFDASMVWAPIFGRMLYMGLRFTIQ